MDARGRLPRALRRALAFASATALSLALPATVASPAQAGNVSPQPRVARLSNLTTLSRWAYPETAAAAHSAPAASAPVVGHLKLLTPDGQAQPYLALRSYTAGARTWVLVPLPGRPNGRRGWVPAAALGELRVMREHLRIDRETFQATLFRGRRRIWSAPVGVGRPSLPTPAGHFFIAEKLISAGSPIYGPYALGTSAYAPTLSEWPGGGVVGIHGTNEPQLIPGRPSHGCVRIRDAAMARLWQIARIGTPIEIV